MDARHQILEAATARFAARGADATSLQEIATAVGLRKASLLYHFPSKEELRQAVLDRLLVRWNERLPQLLKAATGEEQFDGVLKETIAYFSEEPIRARLILREVLDRPQDTRDRLALHVSPWVDVIARHIRSGQQQGRIHPDVAPESYVVLVMNLIVCAFATAESLRTILPGQRTDPAAWAPHVKELLRLAKAALFLPHATET